MNIKKSRFVLMKHKSKSTHYDIRFKIGKDSWESFAIIKGIPSDNKKTLAIRTKIHSKSSALYTGKIKDGKIIKIDSGICEILKYNIGNKIDIKFHGSQLIGLYHFVDIKNKIDQYLFFKGKDNMKVLENYLQNLNESIKVNHEDKIIEFFLNNPNPDDHKVHAFAEEQGMDPDDLEEKIYALLTSLVHLKGGDVPDEKFDPKELAMGIEVEKEHHDNTIIRKAIAKGHLLEIKDYYTRLKKMEKEAGVED